MSDDLTDKEQRFVERYCAHCNGARAAREVGYSDKRERQRAYELLKKDKIREAIDERLEALSMTAAEATRRMTEIAEMDLGDFFVVEDGQAKLDLAQLVEEGPSHLIREVKWTESGPQVKAYDKQKALHDLMKAHGAFNHTQHHDVTSGGEPVSEINLNVVHTDADDFEQEVRE